MVVAGQRSTFAFGAKYLVYRDGNLTETSLIRIFVYGRVQSATLVLSKLEMYYTCTGSLYMQ